MSLPVFFFISLVNETPFIYRLPADWLHSPLRDLKRWNDKEFLTFFSLSLSFPFSPSATSCRYSTAWHIASFHAWQKSVQEANHYYCQIGTAVYSSIMQSSVILSLTITCFTLAPSLTLIYSGTLSAAPGEKNIQSASVVPNCPFFFPPPDIVFFFLVLCLRSHKLHSSSAPLCVLSHKFLTYGHNLTRSGRPGPVLTCAEVPFGSEGNSLVSLYQPYSPGLCCTRLWRNTHK